MLPYSFPQVPPTYGRRLAQEAPAAPVTPTLPQPPSKLSGIPGVFETLAVLAISGAAVYTGVNAGMKEKGYKKYAGWVGGIGAGVIGLLYLGGRANVAGIPQVQIVVPRTAA